MNRFKIFWNNPKQMTTATFIFIGIYLVLKVINTINGN